METVLVADMDKEILNEKGQDIWRQEAYPGALESGDTKLKGAAVELSDSG